MNPSNNDYWVQVPEAESDRKKYTKLVKRGTQYSKAVRSSNKVSHKYYNVVKKSNEVVNM